MLNMGYTIDGGIQSTPWTKNTEETKSQKINFKMLL